MNTENSPRLITLGILVMGYSIGGYYCRRSNLEGGGLKTAEGSRLVTALQLCSLVYIIPLLAYLINPAWVTWIQFSVPIWIHMVGSTHRRLCGSINLLDIHQ